MAVPSCPTCEVPGRSKGAGRTGRRRWQCNKCGKTWTEEPPESVPDDGLVTADRMRKVFGQTEADDRGPTECRLRDMLKKGVKPYLELMDELEGRADRDRKREAELARLRAEVVELKAELAEFKSVGAGEDAGSRRARSLIERILAEADA